MNSCSRSTTSRRCRRGDRPQPSPDTVNISRRRGTSGPLASLGHFKRKYRKCNSCGATWIGHEEKETDVAISTNLVADAFRNRFERALIISADSDLGPAIK